MEPEDDSGDDEDEDETADDEAELLPDPATISDSSHKWANTWQIPSSISGLRFGYPVMEITIKFVPNSFLKHTVQFSLDSLRSKCYGMKFHGLENYHWAAAMRALSRELRLILSVT